MESGQCYIAAGEPRSSLIFLGTGASGGLPYARCLIQPSDPPCSVCFQSFSLPPERNPNYRIYRAGPLHGGHVHKKQPTKPLLVRGAHALYKYSQCSLTLPLRHLSIKSSEMESGDLAENGHCSDAAGEPRSSLILLGTGCSSVVPNAMCLIQPSDPPCNVCFQSLSLPPERNPNYRCNTSLLIDYCQNNGEHKYILIDVGKTFREQVIRWFTFYKIPQVDSIILTHEHADAVLGLDDMRAVQPFSPTNDISPTPVYLSQYAMESIATKFPYLVKKKLKEGQELRRVAQLDWKIIESNHEKPFVASGLQFVPLPVMHGEDYLCLGFLFGEKCKVAYISDISRFPSSTEYVISKNGGGQLDLLILDTLYKKGSHNTHFCFPQTLEAVKRICPKRALLVGMTHEFDHHKDNETLMEWSRREGIPVQLAHDGLRVPIDL